MSILSTNAQGESLTTASLLTAITAPPFSYSFMIKRNAVTASRCLWMWEDSGDTQFLEFMTRNATTTGYHAWRHEQNGGNFTTIYDDAGPYDTWERVTICKAANAELNTWIGGSTFQSTDNYNVTGGANGLDTIFIGGKNPSVNEYGFPAYLYDLAIWPSTELTLSDHNLLKSYYSSTIPKTPTYNWRGESDLTNTLGGIDLQEAGGGTSYSISGDNPTLSNYSASSGVAGIILGGG